MIDWTQMGKSDALKMHIQSLPPSLITNIHTYGLVLQLVYMVDGNGTSGKLVLHKTVFSAFGDVYFSLG